MVSEEEGSLDLYFKLNVSDENKPDHYFDVQSLVNFNTIYKFTSAIKEYLIDTVNDNSK